MQHLSKKYKNYINDIVKDNPFKEDLFTEKLKNKILAKSEDDIVKTSTAEITFTSSSETIPTDLQEPSVPCPITFGIKDSNKRETSIKIRPVLTWIRSAPTEKECRVRLKWLENRYPTIKSYCQYLKRRPYHFSEPNYLDYLHLLLHATYRKDIY